MEYWPLVKSAELVDTFNLGSFSIRVFQNIETDIGLITYHYMLVLFTDDMPKPLLLVTSESSDGLALEGKGKYALGLFRGGRHMTLDIDDQWGDYATFMARAGQIVGDELKALTQASPSDNSTLVHSAESLS